jgi:type II secretory pathway pseudopilin PulG
MISQRGQSTVELVLLLPFVAMLLAAVVEVGMISSDRARLELAAREAVRVAAVDTDEARIRYAAERNGFPDVRMSVSPEASFRRSGEPVTVELEHRPLARLPLIGELFDGVVLRATATMRIEQP